MKKISIAFSLLAAMLLGFGQLSAKENIGGSVHKSGSGDTGRHKQQSAGCDPATAFIDLDINNVRARIMNGGDMWWDLVSTARYEIPKVTEAGQVHRTSLFAGALWIGGFENGNLREAAMTYRQNGNDFFPGPLDTTTATIDFANCKSWDKIWEVTRDEIDLFRKDKANMTDAIRTWPAHGLNGFNSSATHSHYLAPFVDVNGNMKYDPNNGDYPDVAGDQTLWYIYNDKGNIHSETGSQSGIGLELQTQAFAFTTNDEVNDMTFYKTTVINRSKNRLDSCFFGQWVDADLGYAFDDYVGVDVGDPTWGDTKVRNLGICYNGDDNDEGVTGYGANPPAVGVDFFKGPLDENGRELPMSHFVYYNNDFTPYGNPQYPEDYYGYLTGHWKNKDCIRFGADGHSGGTCTNYMFPSFPLAPKPSWSEVSEKNKPGDRRFLQSAGPFSLKPGAKNEVTVGVVWARASSGGATGSLKKLLIADDHAQKLYANNFKLVDGPSAPDVVVHEMNNQLVLTLENTHSHEVELFSDTVLNDQGQKVNYKFQGYQIYQLKNSSISASQLDNPDYARLIAQCDIKDQFTKLVNTEPDPDVDYRRVVKVTGNNNGINHVFKLTDDAFASGDKGLVNFKFYYFMVVAYAVANDPNEPTQYLAGRRNIKVYTGIPHNNLPELQGTQTHSIFGDGPEITRLEGTGNGGNIIDINISTENEILKNVVVKNPTYQGGKGPVSVRVTDPSRVVDGEYELKLLDPAVNNTDNKPLTKNARWILRNKTTGRQVKSDTTLEAGDEQIIRDTIMVDGKPKMVPWGFAITVKQVLAPGFPDIDEKNGFLGATIDFSNPSNRWLSGVFDIDHIQTLPKGTPTPGNWIRSGRVGDLSSWDINTDDIALDDNATPPAKHFLDPAQQFEKMLGGIIAPAALVARSNKTGTNLTLGPIPSEATVSILKLGDLSSVDLVFTSDQSKWTECVVLEAGEAAGINEGGVNKFELRNHAGWLGKVDANGKPVYEPESDTAHRGKSMFPGYAINQETGERLNIVFMEDSHLPAENGNDMIWNPTSSQQNPAAGFFDYTGRYLWGGKHWIWIMSSKTIYNGYAAPYDKGESIRHALKGTSTDRQKMFAGIQWVMEPLTAFESKLLPLKNGLIPTDTRIRLRVNKPYATYNTGNGKNGNLPMYSFSTKSIAATHMDNVAGKSALEMVNISPNPYYATNEYETSQLDNRVRILNLPPKAEVAIYTLDGALVRKFTRDELHGGTQVFASDEKVPATFIDWDLKNQKGIPVSSGVYLIHVNGFELGEKVLKWFGVMKPIDLDTF